MFELYDSITAGFAGGVLAAASIVSVLVSIVSYVLIVIGWWKIFTKAGEAGWKSLIPFYNVIFIQWLFVLILGFGSSEYQGKDA